MSQRKLLFSKQLLKNPEVVEGRRKLDEFKNETDHLVEDIVFNVMTKRAMQLQELSLDPRFQSSYLKVVREKGQVDIPEIGMVEWMSNKKCFMDSSSDSDSDSDTGLDYAVVKKEKIDKFKSITIPEIRKRNNERMINKHKQKHKSSDVSSELETSNFDELEFNYIEMADSRSNMAIVELLELVKPYVSEFIEYCTIFRMWTKSLIQPEKCGSNISDTFQKFIFVQFCEIQKAIVSYDNQFRSYFNNRASLVKRIAKYPFCQDLRKSLETLDENIHWRLTRFIKDVRNFYIVVHQSMTENWRHLTNPQTSNIKNMMI